MSMFENSQYRWRETYFVLFDSSGRPTLKTVERALSALNDQYRLTNLSAGDDGRFDSLTLLSPEDFAALDICYTSGEEVLEQAVSLATELEASTCEAGQRAPSQRFQQFDGRFDVLHFEQVSDFQDEDDESDEMLDPSALLLVLAALSKITNGVAIDPQAGAILSDDD